MKKQSSLVKSSLLTALLPAPTQGMALWKPDTLVEIGNQITLADPRGPQIPSLLPRRLHAPPHTLTGTPVTFLGCHPRSQKEV